MLHHRKKSQDFRKNGRLHSIFKEPCGWTVGIQGTSEWRKLETWAEVKQWAQAAQ